MQEYKIFVSDEIGVFGNLRKVFFVNDKAALDACMRLLDEFCGVDIWCGESRVALLGR